MFTQQRKGSSPGSSSLHLFFFKAVCAVYKTFPSYHFYWLLCELVSYSYQFHCFRPSGAGIKVLCRSVRFTLHSSLLRILLLSKCFRLLCARSTSECFDSCWPSPETSMRIEHRQWGLMKQRRRCWEDGSCAASSLPHNQSVPASICPLDTPIWKECRHSSLITHPMCIIQKKKQGLFCRLHPVLTDIHTQCHLFFFEDFWGFEDCLCAGFI